MAEEYDNAFSYEWLAKYWMTVLDNRDAQFASAI